MRKLTNIEIKHIEKYLDKKGIVYVDLRFETLDHLILQIEDIINNTGIDFSTAFNQVTKQWDVHFKETSSLLFGVIIAMGLEVIKSFYGVFNKSVRRSLKIQQALVLGSLFYPLNYLFIAGFNSFYENVSPKPYIILISVYIILFPLLRHGLNIFMKSFKENRRMYKLMLS